jgi:hypothetical protein
MDLVRLCLQFKVTIDFVIYLKHGSPCAFIQWQRKKNSLLYSFKELVRDKHKLFIKSNEFLFDKYLSSLWCEKSMSFEKITHRGFVPRVRLLEGDETLRCGVSWENFKSWSHGQRGNGTPASYSFSLLFPGHEGLALLCCSHNHVTCPTDIRWPGTSKSVSQNKPCLYISWLSQVFVIVIKANTHIYICRWR